MQQVSVNAEIWVQKQTRKREHHVKTHRNVSASQEMSRIAGKYQKLEEATDISTPIEPSESVACDIFILNL